MKQRPNRQKVKKKYPLQMFGNLGKQIEKQNT